MSPADRALSECRIAYRKLAAENAELRALIRTVGGEVIGTTLVFDTGVYHVDLTDAQGELWASITKVTRS